MGKLKVYGGLVFSNLGSQVRVIIATTSQIKAAQAACISVNQLRNYWSITGNKTELEIALAHPGQMFMASSSMGKDFRPVRNVDGTWVDA